MLASRRDWISSAARPKREGVASFEADDDFVFAALEREERVDVLLGEEAKPARLPTSMRSAEGG